MAIEPATAVSDDLADVGAVLYDKRTQLAEAAEQQHRHLAGHRRDVRATAPWVVAHVDEHVGDRRHGRALSGAASPPSAGSSRIQLSVIAGRASMWRT